MPKAWVTYICKDAAEHRGLQAGAIVCVQPEGTPGYQIMESGGGLAQKSGRIMRAKKLDLPADEMDALYQGWRLMDLSESDPSKRSLKTAQDLCMRKTFLGNKSTRTQADTDELDSLNAQFDTLLQRSK